VCARCCRNRPRWCRVARWPPPTPAPASGFCMFSNWRATPRCSEARKRQKVDRGGNSATCGMPVSVVSPFRKRRWIEPGRAGQNHPQKEPESRHGARLSLDGQGFLNHLPKLNSPA
jgi:hypothetical protein